MDIIVAKPKHLNIVHSIVSDTISNIYTKYYPKGAVNFFLKYHNKESVAKAISNKEVYLFADNDVFVATGSISKNEIDRLYVAKEYQGKGYGTKILDYLENLVFQNYSEVVIYSSLPAQGMYIKRGYSFLEYHKDLTDSGDYLCYYMMKKQRE